MPPSQISHLLNKPITTFTLKGKGFCGILKELKITHVNIKELIK